MGKSCGRRVGRFFAKALNRCSDKGARLRPFRAAGIPSRRCEVRGLATIMQRREGSDRWGRPLQPSVKLIRLAELRSAGLIRGHRPSFLRGSPCRCLYAKEHPLDPWTMFLSCRPAAAGYAGLLTLRDRLNACDAVLRNHLDPHERVLAVGRSEDITIRGSIDTPGGRM
jgi:hypothetical protein